VAFLIYDFTLPYPHLSFVFSWFPPIASSARGPDKKIPSPRVSLTCACTSVPLSHVSADLALSWYFFFSLGFLSLLHLSCDGCRPAIYPDMPCPFPNHQIKFYPRVLQLRSHYYLLLSVEPPHITLPFPNSPFRDDLGSCAYPYPPIFLLAR